MILMGKWWDITRLWRRDTASEENSEGSATSTAATPRTGSGVNFFYPTYSSAKAVATAYRCVQLLCDSMACLRMQYMRMKDGCYQEDTNSTLHYLLTVQPQPEMSAFDFWSMAVQLMLLDGNAYIYPRRVRGELTDLVLCMRGTVGHDALNGVYTVSDAYSGVYGVFKESEIIHLYLHSSDGRRGESVLSHARRTIGIAEAGDVETANRFVNGGNVRGIITNDTSVRGFGEYADAELKKTARSVDECFSRGEHIVSLPGQVDFKQISLSSTDMQFLESRKFTVREICRFFGVHPSFVFDDTSNNYKSAEMANVAFLSMTLDPILKRIENEFTRKLIPASLCCKRVFRFDRKGIYSLDLESLSNYQARTIANGIYTVNDWRRIENQPPVDGGDTVYLSTNLAQLGSEKLSGGQLNNGENGENQ